MTRLSVNINKVATLRNSRGKNNPDLLKVARDCENFGGQGITVHPRPDERHITGKDVYDLKKVVTTELNIEGYPDDRYMNMMRDIRPDQATLVPDSPDALTSDSGWDTINNTDFLKEIVHQLHQLNIRVSVFIDPDPRQAKGAARTGADRVELYTEPYASAYFDNKEQAIQPYIETASAALDQGLEINAGHDLDLHNLAYLNYKLPSLSEVSIGHALICEALYYGLENTIQLYLRQLNQ